MAMTIWTTMRWWRCSIDDGDDGDGDGATHLFKRDAEAIVASELLSVCPDASRASAFDRFGRDYQ